MSFDRDERPPQTGHEGFSFHFFFFFIMENMSERVILSTIHTDKKNFHNRKSDDNCHQTQRKYPEVFFNI